ncbi:MAG: phage integrase SAM-like domain-containing protein [Bacteroides sp.]|nr:phage integrase SAM-like domain-containing protein [Bacteroides sp.]
MTTVYFVFRPSRGRKESAGSVFIRFIHRRRTWTITVAKSIMLSEWDSREQCVVIPPGDNERINYLKDISKKLASRRAVIKAIIDDLDKQRHYTVDEVIEKYTMTCENGTILSYTENLAKELERNNQARTADVYRTCVYGFLKFTGNRNFKLTHINNSIIKQFESDLKGRGKASNTISYYMRNLRAIYNKAIQDRRIREKNRNH